VHRGTLFILLFFGLALGVTLLLLWRCVRRAFREPQRIGKILLSAATSLALWGVVTYFMGILAFETAWGLAHTRPFPDGLFPEGWAIYGWLGAYAVFGTMLVVALGKVPRKLGSA
jgi:hypothetical protein